MSSVFVQNHFFLLVTKTMGIVEKIKEIGKMDESLWKSRCRVRDVPYAEE